MPSYNASRGLLGPVRAHRGVMCRQMRASLLNLSARWTRPWRSVCLEPSRCAKVLHLCLR